MADLFRPMLAADATEGEIAERLQKGPLLCSVKIDGIRGMVRNGVLVSRSLKPLPNRYAQKMFGRWEFEGFDGELVEGKSRGEGVMQRAMTGYMAHDGEGDLSFLVFDLLASDSTSYVERLKFLQDKFSTFPLETETAKVSQLNQSFIRNYDELIERETDAIGLGFEGLILRDPDSPYKHGRSTLKQGWMLKLKRFKDSEAVITGWSPLERNENEAVRDEMGLQRRSSEKGGKREVELLGKFHCRDTSLNWEFSVGSGLDDLQRAQYWAEREQLLGQLLTYKYLPHGSRDAPRHPVFKSLRSPIDMS